MKNWSVFFILFVILSLTACFNTAQNVPVKDEIAADVKVEPNRDKDIGAKLEKSSGDLEIFFSELPEKLVKQLKGKNGEQLLQEYMEQKGWKFSEKKAETFVFVKNGKKASIINDNSNDGKAVKNPSQNPAKISPSLVNVSYGPHQKNVLDFYRASSDKPAPVLVFFHGGGFSAGNKSSVNKDVLEECIKAGISVVSADYRLISEAPFPAAMLDGARVIQFVKSKANEWNIDPQRVALGGGSAGANMSLWLAFKGELAKPDSSDPIEKISTKVSCVLSLNGQSSNDPDFIRRHIYQGDKIHPSIYGFFGIKAVEDMQKPENKKLAYEASAINFLTKDDPPVYLEYEQDLTPTPLPDDSDIGLIIHHPKFGKVLKDEMDAIGIECIFHYRSNPSKNGERINFLKKHLGL